MLRSNTATKEAVCVMATRMASGVHRCSTPWLRFEPTTPTNQSYATSTLPPLPLANKNDYKLSVSSFVQNSAMTLSSRVILPSKPNCLTSQTTLLSNPHCQQKRLFSRLGIKPDVRPMVNSTHGCALGLGSIPRSYSTPRDAVATAKANGSVAATESIDEVRKREQTKLEALTQLLTQRSGLFDDHRNSYGIKPIASIVKALAFFSICRFDFFTNNAEKIMKVARRLLGRRLADALIRAMVYDQFVVEPDREKIVQAMGELGKHGIGTLLCVPIEDDAGSQINEAALDRNLDLILKSIDIATNIGVDDPLVQFRVTALMSGNLAQLVAETSSKSVAPEMDYKGNPALPVCLTTVQALVQAMRGDGFTFLELPAWKNFPSDKVDEFKLALGRFATLAKAITEKEVTAMIDAEATYLNPALRHIVFAMMEICNKDKPRVFYTYQAYLKATYAMLSQDLALAESRGTCFGVKLVRGAYMVRERHLAAVHGYDDPVNATFDLTSESYHRCLNLLLVKAKENEKNIRFILASHNEDTLYYAFERMDQLGLSPLSPAIIFGQLYGMADHISYVLGASGCRVVKSLPYGTMDDTIPYLSRRAQENKSVLLNARKERLMLRTSLTDKIFGIFR